MIEELALLQKRIKIIHSEVDLQCVRYFFNIDVNVPKLLVKRTFNYVLINTQVNSKHSNFPLRPSKIMSTSHKSY